MTKFFELSEFDSPDAPGSGVKMQRDFLIMLDKAREIAALPFHINSGFRTKDHNNRVGGSPYSSHMKGWAVDIRVDSNQARFRIVDALLKAGFTRIGMGVNFIHCDCDPSKPARTIWTY